jgi:hypothetical protein
MQGYISKPRPWDTLVGDRNLWHAITQQKNLNCNATVGGYAWLDSEQLYQDTERSLPVPSPSSYAGVLLGLRSISTVNLRRQLRQPPT